MVTLQIFNDNFFQSAQFMDKIVWLSGNNTSKYVCFLLLEINKSQKIGRCTPSLPLAALNYIIPILKRAAQDVYLSLNPIQGINLDV